MDERIKQIVFDNPIPERLIQSLSIAPVLRPDHIDMWVRCGGRITNHKRKPSANLYVYLGPRIRLPSERLSESELESLRLIASGKTNKEVAYELGIDQRNLEMRLRQAKFRLDRSKTNERAVLVAAARGLIELPNEKPLTDTLDNAERIALGLWKEGANSKDIAKAMGVSVENAKTKLRVCRRKLRVRTTAEAAAILD